MAKQQLRDMTEPEIKELMNAVGGGIEFQASQFLCDKAQFVVVLFNDPQVRQYCSNCTRETMIEALKELVERLERKQDVER